MSFWFCCKVTSTAILCVSLPDFWMLGFYTRDNKLCFFFPPLQCSKQTQVESEREQNIYHLLLTLTTEFNTHTFAQNIKLAHSETTGQIQASLQRQEAHPLEEERRLRQKSG